MDKAIFELVRARKVALQSQSDKRDDVLSLLLSARDESGAPHTENEVRDERVTMLLAFMR